MTEKPVTIRKKAGVSPLAKAHPKILEAIDAAAEVTPLAELVINSLDDSNHRAGSYQYGRNFPDGLGRAVDIQTRFMASGEEVKFCRDLAARLGCTEERTKDRDWWEPGGNGYRVLLESLNVDGKEHLHLEFRGTA